MLKLTLCQMKKFGLVKTDSIADEKINVVQKLKSIYWWFESSVVKGENDGYKYSLHFPQGFQKSFL